MASSIANGQARMAATAIIDHGAQRGEVLRLALTGQRVYSKSGIVLLTYNVIRLTVPAKAKGKQS